MEEEKESDFGKGLVYCLGLFIAHQGMFKDDVSHWFNAATDHLCELDATMILDEGLKEEIECWVKAMIKKRHEYKHTVEDVTKSIDQAKGFLLRIDKDVIGVDAVKAEWA